MLTALFAASFIFWFSLSFYFSFKSFYRAKNKVAQDKR